VIGNKEKQANLTGGIWCFYIRSDLKTLIDLIKTVIDSFAIKQQIL